MVSICLVDPACWEDTSRETIEIPGVHHNIAKDLTFGDWFWQALAGLKGFRCFQVPVWYGSSAKSLLGLLSLLYQTP